MKSSGRPLTGLCDQCLTEEVFDRHTSPKYQCSVCHDNRFNVYDSDTWEVLANDLRLGPAYQAKLAAELDRITCEIIRSV